MQPIISGTSSERKGRTIFITIMLVAFSAWYFYDGTVKYPKDNLSAARDALNPRPEELPPISPDIHRQTAANIAPGEPIDAVVARLGPPGWQHSDERRWFAPGGQVKVTVRNGTVSDAEWIDGKFDTTVQLWIGSIMGVLGFAMLVQLVRVLRTRVVLDDNGLHLGSKPPIPFDAMSKIDASRYKEKGWVTLYHSSDARERQTRLDCDVIDLFRPIIEAICARKSWDSPLPPPRKDDDDDDDE